jgi:type IV secretory pathway VirB2 component (pilin)
MHSIDPAGATAITSAVGWFAGSLLGTIATSVTIIAIASAGLLMLTHLAES